MAKQQKQIEVDLNEVVGGGYGSFWRSKNFFRVVKGGRASKKSTTAAMWYIYNIMKYPLSNAVVVRKVYTTHKNSTFAELKKAAERLRVYDKWRFTESPYEAKYLPTGQKILFYGFDDPMKLTSMTVDKGFLCWAWFEEVFELDDESEFDTFIEGIRGKVPEPLFKQVTLTYNPWINSHWTKERFWDQEYPNTFRLTTTHKCNEFLDDADHQRIEELKITNPERYKVVGLGEYGLPGGVYFDEFREDIHVVTPFDISEDCRKYRVFDYGLDMLACYWIAVYPQGKAYVYKELYESGHIISSAAKRIHEVTGEDKIYETIAPPDMRNKQKDTGKSIQEVFEDNGIWLTIASNDRVTGWLNLKEWLTPYESKDLETGEDILDADLKIFNTCKNLISSIESITQDEKDPNDCALQPHNVTHAPDALRYWIAGRPCPTKIKFKKPKQKLTAEFKAYDKRMKQQQRGMRRRFGASRKMF